MTRTTLKIEEKENKKDEHFYFARLFSQNEKNELKQLVNANAEADV